MLQLCFEVLAILFVVLAVYIAVLYFVARPFGWTGALKLRTGIEGLVDDPLRSQLVVNGTAGLLRCPMLIDTGYTGQIVINETLLMASQTYTVDKWNALTYAQRERAIDSITTGYENEDDLIDDFERAGGTYERSATRTMEALSGVFTTSALVGNLNFTLGDFAPKQVASVTEFVPGTSCIITLQVLLRMRPVVFDCSNQVLSINRGLPEHGWQPPQQGFQNVIMVTATIFDRDVKLIVDTGYGGCIALNENVGLSISESRDCSVSNTTIAQSDVHANEVCASVMFADCRLGGVHIGADVPVYINNTNLTHADGLVGLELLKAFPWFAITTNAFALPRLVLAELSQTPKWCKIKNHIVARDGFVACSGLAPAHRDQSCPTETLSKCEH